MTSYHLFQKTHFSLLKNTNDGLNHITFSLIIKQFDEIRSLASKILEIKSNFDQKKNTLFDVFLYLFLYFALITLQN